MDLIRQAAPGSTMRNRALAIERFEALEIPLPPIEEQRRVTDHLDRIAVAGQEVQARLSLADEIVNALLSSFASTEGKAVQLRELLESATRPVALQSDVTYSLLGCRWYGDGLFVRRTEGRVQCIGLDAL